MNDEPFLGICCYVDVSLLSFRDDTVVFMLVVVDCVQCTSGRHPTTGATALCFGVPPRLPRLVGNLAARPRSTKVLHVVAFMRDEQERRNNWHAEYV